MRVIGRVAGVLLIASIGLAENRQRLVVVHTGHGSIALVDPSSGVADATVRVGAGPRQVAISPDGETAVVANYGFGQGGSSLSVVDLVAARMTRTIQLRLERQIRGGGSQKVTYHRPHGITFTRDGQYVLVTCESESALLMVDVADGVVVEAIDTGQELSHLVVLSRDGRKAFVANEESGSVSVIDLDRHRLEKVIETGGGAAGMAVHPTRDELWVANHDTNSISIVDTESLEELVEFPCGAYPVRLAFTPDGEHVLCVNYQAGTVSVFASASRKVRREIDLDQLDPEAAESRPLAPEHKKFGKTCLPSGVLVRPDGETAYVSCGRSDRVAEIDVSSWKVVRYLDTAKEPDGLAWASFQDDVQSAK